MRGAARDLFPIIVLIYAGQGVAASIDAQVRDASGRPVADAVVYAVPVGITLEMRGSRTVSIQQLDREFVPYVSVIQTGTQVDFPNRDPIQHHVYSFSPAKAFEFVLAPGQSSPPMTLSNSGVIAVGCNIHDQMASYLVVSDAPWTATTGHDGRALITALPPGTYDVQAWHPRLRPGRRNVPLAQVTVPAGATATLSFPLALLPDTRMQHDREHVRY